MVQSAKKAQVSSMEAIPRSCASGYRFTDGHRAHSSLVSLARWRLERQLPLTVSSVLVPQLLHEAWPLLTPCLLKRARRPDGSALPFLTHSVPSSVCREVWPPVLTSLPPWGLHLAQGSSTLHDLSTSGLPAAQQGGPQGSLCLLHQSPQDISRD